MPIGAKIPRRFTSRRVASALGGALSLEPTRQGATRFVLRLRAPKAQNVTAKPAALAAKRVLLAEDEPLSRRVLASLLARSGAEVVTASDGGEALMKAAAQPFDQIVLDVRMPIQGGLDVARALRKRDLQTPITLISAAFDPSTINAATELGMSYSRILVTR